VLNGGEAHRSIMVMRFTAVQHIHKGYFIFCEFITPSQTFDIAIMFEISPKK